MWCLFGPCDHLWPMCAPVMCRGGPTQHSDVGVGPVVTGVLGISMDFGILGGWFSDSVPGQGQALEWWWCQDRFQTVSDVEPSHATACCRRARCGIVDCTICHICHELVGRSPFSDRQTQMVGFLFFSHLLLVNPRCLVPMPVSQTSGIYQLHALPHEIRSALLLSCQANEPLQLETSPITGASWLLSGHPPSNQWRGPHPLIKHIIMSVPYVYAVPAQNPQINILFAFAVFSALFLGDNSRLSTNFWVLSWGFGKRVRYVWYIPALQDLL